MGKIEFDLQTQTWQKTNQLSKLAPKRLEESWLAKLSMEQKQKLTPHGLRVQKNRNLFKRMFTSEIQTSLKVIINSRGHESQQPRQRSFFFSEGRAHLFLAVSQGRSKDWNNGSIKLGQFFEGGH